MNAERRAQILTFDAIAEQYPLDRFILLMPQVSRHLLTTIPMWSLDVATVKVDPNDNAQAYAIQGDDMGLTKVTLDLLAQAADLTVACRRIDDRRDRMFAEYEAWAIMNTPSGGVRGQSRTCEWDGITAQEKVRAAAERFVSMAENKGWSNFKNLNAEQRQRRINERFNEQWAREQEFGKRMVESKAGNRAVRALLGIQSKYNRADLAAKAFAVVRFVFTPDLEDREIRLMVVGAGLHAQRMLYPTANMAPVSFAPDGITSASALPPPVAEQRMIVHDSDQTDDAAVLSPTVEPSRDDDDSDDWSAAEAKLPAIYFAFGLLAAKDEAQYAKLNKRLTKYMSAHDASGVLKLHAFMASSGLIEG